jgi:HTH-type transcriptional repressor of NAD biosynthesis genes
MQYKVGLYGGCFDPLHLGHVDCIFQAANRCEELYIVLVVSTKVKQIDYRIRYRWLYQLTEHIGNVKILLLEDHCNEKSEYTPDAAKADCEYIKVTIGKPIDAVFCGSDYDKDSFWGVCYPQSDFVSFPRNEMSSTQLRKNPYAHWDWIPTIARPYFVKKVLLVGGESVGKSTLTINLANRFNTNYIDEAGRDISMRSGDDRLMLQQDYTEILLRHKLNEMEAIRHSNKVLFLDTDALVTRFYLEFLDKETSENNMALADAIDAINSYDLILFLEPDVKFVQDGGRSEIIHADRMKYSEQIKDILRAHSKNFVCISGDYQQRYSEAVKEVQKLFAGQEEI